MPAQQGGPWDAFQPSAELQLRWNCPDAEIKHFFNKGHVYRGLLPTAHASASGPQGRHFQLLLEGFPDLLFVFSILKFVHDVSWCSDFFHPFNSALGGYFEFSF